MLCAAVARVGPFPVSWWGIWDRYRETLHERTRHNGRLVRFDPAGRPGPGRPRQHRLAFAIGRRSGPGVETLSPHGTQYAWTRKQGGVRFTGAVAVGDRRFSDRRSRDRRRLGGLPRAHTSWMWSAGVGPPAGDRRRLEPRVGPARRHHLVRAHGLG